MQSTNILDDLASIAFILFFRIALPIIPAIWLIGIAHSDWQFLLILLLLWLTAPLVLISLLFDLLMSALASPAVFPESFSVLAVFLAAIRIINKPVFISPNIIPLLIVFFKGSRSIMIYNTDLWTLPANLPTKDEIADAAFIRKRIQELEARAASFGSNNRASRISDSPFDYDWREYLEVISLLKDILLFMDPHERTFSRPMTEDNFASSYECFAELRKQLFKIGKLYRILRYAERPPYSKFLRSEYIEGAIDNKRHIFQRAAARMEFFYF